MTPASSLDQPSFTPPSTQTRTHHLVSGLGEDQGANPRPWSPREHTPGCRRTPPTINQVLPQSTRAISQHVAEQLALLKSVIKGHMGVGRGWEPAPG